MDKNNNLEETTVDKRGRTWEIYYDIAYYDMWCVRFTEDRNFNSSTSFHFNLYKDAKDFFDLIQKSF